MDEADLILAMARDERLRQSVDFLLDYKELCSKHGACVDSYHPFGGPVQFMEEAAIRAEVNSLIKALLRDRKLIDG